MISVAIVGGGVAGLTTGAALARVGIACQVYEQSAGFGEIGAGIQLAPNATRLLHRLDGIRLTDRAATPSAQEMRQWRDGAVVRRTELGQACVARFGAPYYTFHRADLHRCLLDLMPSDALVSGRRCVGVDDTPDAAVLHFADGGTVSADLVVGADGIRSTVRTLFAADRPRFSGQVMYRGLVPAERVPHLVADPKVTVWLGPGRHCVCYPVAGGELVNIAATSPEDGWQTESWTEPGRMTDLLAGYDGWYDDVVTLMSSADTVTRWALHDRDPIDTWRGDRVVLVGDAAHPMLPFAAQGANQAVEDAFVLAQCLSGAEKDAVPDALRRYESLRKPRTDQVQELSRANQQRFHQTDEQREAGDVSGLTAHTALFGFDAEAEASTPEH